MKIDFRKLEYVEIDGKTKTIDVSKDLGNAIFRQTMDIGELDLARDVYHKGEVELTKKDAEILKKYSEPYFLAFIKEVLIPALDLIINEDEEANKVKPIKK